MQTRRGSYPDPETATSNKRQGRLKRKRQIFTKKASKRFWSEGCDDHFQSLPDDLIISIFRCLCSRAVPRADFINAMLTCRRFCSIATHPQVRDLFAVNKWKLSHEYRQKMVNKIMDTLQRHMPPTGADGTSELRKIALRFEEKIYTYATEPQDHLRKICLKMLLLRNHVTVPSPLAGSSRSN